MAKDPSYYEARILTNSDVADMADISATSAEMDLTGPFSTMLYTWEKLAEMGIENPSRDDFLNMYYIVQSIPNLGIHPTIRRN